MTNYLTTRCEITGPEELVELWLYRHIRPTRTVFAGLVMNDPQFDFNSVIPMPPCVEVVDASPEALAGFYALTGLWWQPRMLSNAHPFACFQKFPLSMSTTHKQFEEWLRKHAPTVLQQGENILVCFRQTGFLSPAAWTRATWGCESNSYEYRPVLRAPGQVVLRFQTSWEFPAAVFEALTSRYPDLVFKTDTINEGAPKQVLAGQSLVGKFVTATESCSAETYKEVYGYERDKS